jgi:hypothetical protein
MGDQPKNISVGETVHCPVCGHDVDVTASYKIDEKGERALAGFTCILRGRCGIPAWDPCPMYVRYLEENRKVS